MDTRDLVTTIIILLETVLGILGNFSLLSRHLFLHLTGCRLKPTDLIIRNLMVANIFVLSSGGIRHLLRYFGLYQDSDLGCRLFPYVRGVSRGVSIFTTCLLSVFQAITIVPRGSRWGRLKDKAPQGVVPCIVLGWVLSLLVNVVYPMFLSSILSHRNNTNRKSYGLCSSVRHDRVSDFLYGALLSGPDVVFFVSMLWASGSMVWVLHRHRRRVLHLHRSSRTSATSSPEVRATRTILLLVSAFIGFYTISSTSHFLLSVFSHISAFLTDFNIVVTQCFPTFSPFLLLSRESKVSMPCSAWMRGRKPPSPLRNM